ncbi:30-kDa cleavage and polyadenylation specificity factor 30 [Heracleum sosnowskyi]|uniref:30-kDa cleavage and polyadenylation specificity factor 30 n=1 Tax=Heracleum sosnowskyi TaxID=360622 RepID=A0AAD8MK44_9APIA|nr:30-kDa cleavage and polyadenylation specificity factor 30 [Heracleum sosnowskyi]
MDDAEGGLNFDFEGGLDSGPARPTASVPVIHQPDPNSVAVASAANNTTNFVPPPDVSDQPAPGNFSGRRSYRQTVCRHWLRSLCMKGEACGFLHQYDKSRMPICRFFRLYGECREQDCVYKHTNEDIKECNMYKLGFCPNGPDCRYRHAKLPGPPPPVEEVLQKIQQLTSYNYNNSNRFYQNRNPNYNQHTERPHVPPGANGVHQVIKSTPAESPNVQQQQQQQQIQQTQQPVVQAQAQNLLNGQQSQASRSAIPLPQGISRYFIVKSCNRENFELSVQQGVWATQRSNEAKLNEAFDSVENVILIFSVNRTRNFQGCAKMTSKIGGSVGGGNWKYAHGTAHYGRNFSVKWLKLCELSFHKTRHLRNPYNENLPVKISRDCQELEPSVGEQLASLLYLEPDSELMEISLAAELKREEEKAKGDDPEDGTENQDIVPFEDNEEEEEEESDEEDQSFSQGIAMAAQGRGRGRGMMWPPHMPLARGARPMPGMRGFPPVMMGPDGFPYGPLGPDGFPMPDLFNTGPRGFGPYGPRFSGDFAGPGGMMFQGRPFHPGNFPGGGFGMMGPGRAPFMGGGSAGRPGGLHPMYPPHQSQPSLTSNKGKRDQKATINDRSDRYSAGSDQGKGVDMVGSGGGQDDEVQHQQNINPQQEQIGVGNSFKNDESASEDEAPRRSRHGEGRKKRRSSERDEATGLENQE